MEEKLQKQKVNIDEQKNIRKNQKLQKKSENQIRLKWK